jgi:UDP-N-acetylmuramate--alanine ligase
MKIFSKYKKVYLSGIGGIGVSAIARLFDYHDVKVLGSDHTMSSITKDLESQQIKVYYEQVADNIDVSIDLFIYSPALPKTHPERQKAKELNIDSYSYPEFLGLLTLEYKSIAISGTHGKSTTTTILGLILEAAKLDPTVIVGAQVANFDHNLRVGKSDKLVLEACEYRGHMLKQNPTYICLTNMESDHLDYYKDLEDIKEHFYKFADKVDNNKLFLNIDSKPLFEMHEELHGVSFAIENPAYVRAANIFVDQGKQYFDLYINNTKIQQISLNVPGRFNIYNTLGAIAVANDLGVKPSVYKKVLSEYKGCWRRFELLGNIKYKKKTLLISDYAHHPTAVRETIQAAKEFYPDRRLIVVFEPHQHNRTKELFEDFVLAFSQADFVILSEIYDVKGREEAEDQLVSSKDLVDEIINRGQLTVEQIEYSPNLRNTKKRIISQAKSDDVVLIMGAGDIDTIARKIVEIK